MKTGKEIWDDPVAKEEYVNTMVTWSQDIFREKFYNLPYDALPYWLKHNLETRPAKRYHDYNQDSL